MIQDLKGAAGLAEQELEDFLSQQFKTRDAAHWVKKLVQAGMGATRLGSLSELLEAYCTDADIDTHACGPTYQFTRYEDHPSGHRIDIIAPCDIRLRFAALAIQASTVKYGKDTREILVELGYCNEEIKMLFEEGVLSESWGEQYIPD